MFLKEHKVSDLEIFTPTKWQTVILRNYGMVPNSLLANTLSISENRLLIEAKRLGLDYISFDGTWLKNHI